MTRFAHITGWGMAIPEKILTNQELSKIVDTSHDWIVSRTGIHERRIVSDGESTATLAREAALKALEIANLKPADVDLIIVSTSSPEHIFPATACLVQDEIGATKAGAFDLSAACTGFIYALEMATQAIRGGSISNAIVIGSETLSRFVNWKDRGTCILFGDGAGAFVLQGSDEPGGLISTIMRSDGSGKDLLSLPAGGSKLPASKDTIGNGLHYIQMSGREVFRFATKVMAQATLDALDKAQMSLEDIDLIIPHQANYRIIDMAARNLNFPMERVFINVDHYGNTSTASIPIATCEAIQKGILNPGDKVVFVGFGAGLTWGAAVAQWSKPFPFERRVYPARYRILARIRSLLLRMVRRIEGWIWGKSG
jgi:3-oxoacyl-[acyl-carrier-protein] synthase-3